MDEPEPITDPKLLYDERGVDRSLIRWALQRTPAERLAELEACARGITELCRQANGRLPLR